MNITYKDDKDCNCYKDLMKNPIDRMCIKKFTKTFGLEIIKSATRLHERLISFNTALDYNKVFGKSDNRIEIVSGTGKKENLVLKVRITNSFRKFFYSFSQDGENVITTEEWIGQFNEVEFIHVFEINKHDYKNL